MTRDHYSNDPETAGKLEQHRRSIDRPRKTFKRDPETERLWFSVTMETHNDLGEPFDPARGPIAAVRHHGRIVAYYSGHNGTALEAQRSAEASIPGRILALCGLLDEQ